VWKGGREEGRERRGGGSMVSRKVECGREGKERRGGGSMVNGKAGCGTK
jgi:hypothetical protein